SRTYLWANRGKHLPRRSEPRTTFFQSSRGRMVTISHTDCWSLPLWRGRAPRRRRNRRSRTQCCTSSPARLEERQVQPGGGLSRNVVFLEESCPKKAFSNV